jgi:hypothetical protein
MATPKHVSSITSETPNNSNAHRGCVKVRLMQRKYVCDWLDVPLNLPTHFPSSFNPVEWELNQTSANAIPPRTIDRTEGLYFSRSFSLEEIEQVKIHIKKPSSKSAKGNDNVSYTEIGTQSTQSSHILDTITTV